MIREIYEALSERGLVRGLRQFSTNYLGKAHNYMSDNKPYMAAGALIHLANRLREAGQHDLSAKVVAVIFSGERVVR